MCRIKKNKDSVRFCSSIYVRKDDYYVLLSACEYKRFQVFQVWLAICGYLSAVSSNPIKGSCCFLQQKNWHLSVLSTGWFQEQIQAWFLNWTKWIIINICVDFLLISKYTSTLQLHYNVVLYNADSTTTWSYITQTPL